MTMETALGGNGISVVGTTAAVSVTLNNTSPASGAVDIFVANQGSWANGATMVAQLTDPNPGDSFASSLSLSADGRTLAVGAPQATIGPTNAFGKVFVFQEPAGRLGQTTTANPAVAVLDDNTPQALDGQLGRAVSISADGSRIAAGLPGFSQANPGTSARSTCSTAAGATWSTAADVQPSATASTGSARRFPRPISRALGRHDRCRCNPRSQHCGR